MTGLHRQSEIVADRYQIVTELGRGSMGTTYAAVDVQTSQPVAMKTVSLRQVTEWKVLELFEREARVLETLQHPGIPKYIDYFHLDTADDRRFYLIQELVEGESLLALREQGWQPDEAEVTAIAQQILDILIYIHGLQPPVIHRDIKPENLLRATDGRVVLVDFGAVQEVYRTTLHSGTFVGTLGYMPPEQFHSQTVPASDLYSLGATLVFLLSGRAPAELPMQRMKLDFRDAVTVSVAFADWLERLLEPALEDRVPDAATAQATLTGQSTPPAYRQPPDSQVALQQIGDRLDIEIPNATWWHGGRMTLLVANMLWNLLAIPTILLLGVAIAIALTDSASLVEAVGVAIVLAIPTALLGSISWLLWRLARAAKGDRVILRLDPYETRLCYQFWPLRVTLRGATNAVELHQDPVAQQFLELDYPASAGTRRLQWGWQRRLRHSVQYRLARGLTAAERAWLYTTITQFLTQQSESVPAPPAPVPAGSRLPDSRVRVARAADSLQIDVPCEGSPALWAGIGVAVLVGICVFFPVVFIGAILLATLQGRFFWTLAGSFRLRLDRESYLLEWNYLGYRHQTRGKTAAIREVAMCHTDMEVNGRPVYTCGLVTEHRNILFGTWLRSHEKDALIATLNEFLEEQRD